MEFFQRLPKVELHAHINGSICPSLLRQLVDEYVTENPKNELHKDYDSILKKLQTDETEEITLADGFVAFSCIHRVSGNEKSVQRIVKNVLASFAADSVIYLELRTTPRAEPASGMTKRSYLTTVLREIHSYSNSSAEMEIRLLVSIDRRKGVQDALDTLHLIDQLRPEYGHLIAGIDVSGDPAVGNLLDYVDVLKDARLRGWKVAVHLAEIPNREETEAFLKVFLPDRIGHGTCLTAGRGGSDAIEKIVSDNRIPLELCPSSNVITKTVAGFDDLHFKEWAIDRDDRHPVAVSTDDMGVFKTSLSKEYFLLARHFRLSRERVTELARQPIDFIFADEDTKQSLRTKFDKQMSDLHASGTE